MLVFLISRKFHPSFGLVGLSASPDKDATCEVLVQQYELDIFLTDQAHRCDAADKIACRRGWEW